MVGTRGFVLSSPCGRCRDADSLRSVLSNPYKHALEACLSRSHLCISNNIPIQTWSGREDLNLRPPVPHTGALAKLRHVPPEYILN